MEGIYFIVNLNDRVNTLGCAAKEIWTSIIVKINTFEIENKNISERHVEMSAILSNYGYTDKKVSVYWGLYVCRSSVKRQNENVYLCLHVLQNTTLKTN